MPWRASSEPAVALRELPRRRSGSSPFARSTGGKGLHVVVPLVRRSTWDEVRDFAQGVAQQLVRAAPDQFTAVMSKARRKGKIFIDWVRNTREATAIASYSTRARPGCARCACRSPGTSSSRSSAPLRESIREVPRRLAMPDPWATLRGVAAPALAGSARSRQRVKRRESARRR